MNTTEQCHLWISVRDIERHVWMIENEKDGALMALVPGGKFLVGCDNEVWGKFEVELSAYYIGLTCVTNEQYGRFVSETMHRMPNTKTWQEEGKAKHPVTNVSWEDAQAYCKWTGLRLPSDLEWEKAARGVDGRKYPWGNEWNEKNCRNEKSKENVGVANVWSYPIGASPWGALQMSGNVWEWCEDSYDATAYGRYRKGDMKSPESGQSRVVRGGSWVNNDLARLAASGRYESFPDLRSHSTGFRCAVCVSR